MRYQLAGSSKNHKTVEDLQVQFVCVGVGVLPRSFDCDLPASGEQIFAQDDKRLEWVAT